MITKFVLAMTLIGPSPFAGVDRAEIKAFGFPTLQKCNDAITQIRDQLPFNQKMLPGASCESYPATPTP